MEPSIDPLENRLGAMMGVWKLEEVLGAGGMAAVYRGSQASGVVRAIKVLHPHVAREPSLRARFAQEVDALSRVSHPGIVQVEDLGATADGSAFIVMELLVGETLHARLKRELMDERGVLWLLGELLDALSAAHAADVIHRDIKPENLFLSGTGLKVMDFGIAKVMRESIAQVNTETGTFLGTPSYMAQEQIKGVQIDHRVDLFAAAAVGFKALTGRFIHDDPDPQRRLMKMLTTSAPSVRTAAPGVSAHLALVIDRGLAFEPHDRYPDARTMQADVQAVMTGAAPPYATAMLASPSGTSRIDSASGSVDGHGSSVAGSEAGLPSGARGLWLVAGVVLASVLIGVVLVIVATRVM